MRHFDNFDAFLFFQLILSSTFVLIILVYDRIDNLRNKNILIIFMHNNFFAYAIFTAAIIDLLGGLLLLARSKDGDRSRLILAGLQFSTGIAIVLTFIVVSSGMNMGMERIGVPKLLIGFFSFLVCLMYSIEVISPRWLNLKRVTMLCIPVAILLGIYLISRWLGVEYMTYATIMDMVPNITHFEVWFRLILCLLIFTPAFYIFFIPNTYKYNNANKAWMRTFVTLITINCFSSISSMFFPEPIVYISFFCLGIACRFMIVYIELFIRLEGRPTSKDIVEKKSLKEFVPVIDQEQGREDIEVASLGADNMLKSKTTILFEQMDEYMHKSHAWRDPDISRSYIVGILKTNRTTLTQVIQEYGYESYSAYVNNLRIEDFIQIIKSRSGIPFQEAFYNVGFRTQNTARRNFRRVTGTTPSEYFYKLGDNQ